MFTRLIYAASLLTSCIAAFHLYPTVNPDALAKSFGISTECLDALNTTLPCDDYLFQWASTVDNYMWSESNVTTLCTPACVQSVQLWNTDVQERCTDSTINVFGKAAPADSIAGRYFEGSKIACSQPDFSSGASNVNTSSWGSPSWNVSNLNLGKGSWCLIESQQWIGSDVIQPHCDDNSTDPSCSGSTNVEPAYDRIANLYDSDLLCSDCFLKLFYMRIASTYLPDQDYSDYLIEQYQDIIDVCNASMPELVIRAPPAYPAAPAPLPSSGIVATTGGSVANGTCSGQKISRINIQKDCNEISPRYSITTGDLQAATGNDQCILSAPVCVPAPCTLKQVTSGATCEKLAGSWSISVIQLLTWNPNINGLCDSLKEGDYVCASAPGGTYVPLPPPAGSANASGQARGGGDSSTDGDTSAGLNSTNTTTSIYSSQSSSSPLITNGTSTSKTGSTAAVPSPTQSGISSHCNKYAQAKSGDYCVKFAQDNGVTTEKLYAWNTVLGSGGDACDKQFWTNYYYCISIST